MSSYYSSTNEQWNTVDTHVENTVENDPSSESIPEVAKASSASTPAQQRRDDTVAEGMEIQ